MNVEIAVPQDHAHYICELRARFGIEPVGASQGLVSSAYPVADGGLREGDGSGLKDLILYLSVTQAIFPQSPHEAVQFQPVVERKM